MKHLPLSNMEEAFEAMRKEAVPGDCELCGDKNVPTVEIFKVGDESQKKRVCVACMTGSKPKKLSPEESN